MLDVTRQASSHLAAVAGGVDEHGHDEAGDDHDGVTRGAHEPDQLVQQLQRARGELVGQALDPAPASTLRQRLEPTRPVQSLNMSRYSLHLHSTLEPETKVCEDFTLTMNSPTRAFSLLKAPKLMQRSNTTNCY